MRKEITKEEYKCIAKDIESLIKNIEAKQPIVKWLLEKDLKLIWHWISLKQLLNMSNQLL